MKSWSCEHRAGEINGACREWYLKSSFEVFHEPLAEIQIWWPSTERIMDSVRERTAMWAVWKGSEERTLVDSSHQALSVDSCCQARDCLEWTWPSSPHGARVLMPQRETNSHWALHTTELWEMNIEILRLHFWGALATQGKHEPWNLLVSWNKSAWVSKSANIVSF